MPIHAGVVADSWRLTFARSVQRLFATPAIIVDSAADMFIFDILLFAFSSIDFLRPRDARQEYARFATAMPPMPP